MRGSDAYRHWPLGYEARVRLAMQPVPLHEPVERRSVDARNACGLGHVARRALQEPSEVSHFELGDDAIALRMVTHLHPAQCECRLRVAARRVRLVAQGKVALRDRESGLRDDRDMFHHVLQFADVSAPRMRGQRAKSRLGEFRRRGARHPPLGPVPIEEIIGEQRDVLASLAQRRNVDRHDAKAIEEILAEITSPHGFFRVTIGCGDDADVYHRVFVAAAAPDDAVLQHAKQLGLRRLGHLDDVVDEERSAAGRLEQANLVPHGVRYCSRAVAEQLGFKELLRQRATTQRDERARRAAALLMREPREEFLARSALAGDQHCCIRRRDASCEFHRATKSQRGTELNDWFVFGAMPAHAFRRFGLARHHYGVRGTPHEHLQVRGREGLGQVVPCTCLQHFEARLQARITSHHDHERRGVRLECRA